MSEVKLHPNCGQHSQLVCSSPNPLPQLLRTPSGLALLELQGTINLPTHDIEDLRASIDAIGDLSVQQTSIGRLIFPDHHPETQEPGSTAWMKRVYLYVGKHQRLTGEVKKLPKAIAIIRKRQVEGLDMSTMDTTTDEENGPPDELEVVEIIKWKILFSSRPEPVGTWTGET